MSELLQKALTFESPLSLSHFLEENQAAVAVVSGTYTTQAEMNETGFEDGVELYPAWVVDELRQQINNLNDMIEPHPPSRDCHCKTCTDIFTEKDKAPADGRIYETKPIAEWNDTNAQIAMVMVLTGTDEQKKNGRAFLLHHLRA